MSFLTRSSVVVRIRSGLTGTLLSARWGVKLDAWRSNLGPTEALNQTKNSIREAHLTAPIVLVCSCGAAQIPAPIGSTEVTRYTCRRCCAKIQRQRNIESLHQFLQRRARLP